MNWRSHIAVSIFLIISAMLLYMATFIPYTYFNKYGPFFTMNDFDIIRWNANGILDLAWIMGTLQVIIAWCRSRPFDYMSYFLKWLVLFLLCCKLERVIVNLIKDGEMFWWEWCIHAVSLIAVLIKARYDISKCSSLR